MKYNSACKVPHCFLVGENGQDQEMALEELQEYIEEQNQKLNAENRFSNKDIIVKIHYRYCPNLTIVDTPGALLFPMPTCLKQHMLRWASCHKHGLSIPCLTFPESCLRMLYRSLTRSSTIDQCTSVMQG